MRYLIFTLLSVMVLTGAGCESQQPQETQPVDTPEVTQTDQAPQEQPETDNAESNDAEPTETETNTQNTKNTQEESPNDTEMETSLYEGTWFDIEYPSEFTANPQPAEDSLNNRAQTEEATFTSPDGAVEFFVYSPLWSGEPESYLEVKPSEELVDEKEQVLTEEENPDQYGDRVIRWVTIEAKDGSYTRSYVSRRAQVDTGSEVHHVFGIKYENQAAYDKYKDAYEAFKDSLIQYAD